MKLGILGTGMIVREFFAVAGGGGLAVHGTGPLQHPAQCARGRRAV